MYLCAGLRGGRVGVMDRQTIAMVYSRDTVDTPRLQINALISYLRHLQQLA
jgi:hypothetical protein